MVRYQLSFLKHVFTHRRMIMGSVTASGSNPIIALLDSIVSQSATVSAEGKTHNFCIQYVKLPVEEKRQVLKHIAIKYNFDNENVKKAAESFMSLQDQGIGVRLKSAERLRLALHPCYQEIFGLIAKLDGGVKFLVDLRADVLNFLPLVHYEDSVAHHLKALNNHMKDILCSLFSVGCLSLERITWESSCDMLQKISEYEAVHPMRNWTDLKQRVGAYRRCYVFTHSSMAKEPIVVLHTALTEDISSTIHAIVAQQRMHSEGDISNAKVSRQQIEDPRKIQAAIFYSITSTQTGLRGIELGNQLIKRAVREVLAEFPHIKKISTLSPIPGFREWLLMEISKIDKGEPNSSSLIITDLLSPVIDAISSTEVNDSPWFTLSQYIKRNRWIQDAKLTDLLHLPLIRICAHYLCKEKRRSYVLNNVAHFHLRNGAVIWRINWGADFSPRGLDNSCGLMVNYRYFLEDTENNSKKYVESYHVEISDQIHRLLLSEEQH